MVEPSRLALSTPSPAQCLAPVHEEPSLVLGLPVHSPGQAVLVLLLLFHLSNSTWAGSREGELPHRCKDLTRQFLGLLRLALRLPLLVFTCFLPVLAGVVFF